MRPSAPFALLASLACSAQSGITHFWSGALHPQGITIRARTAEPDAMLRVAYCALPCTSGYAYSASAPSSSEQDQVVHVQLTGLEPGRAYTYRFEVNGVIDESDERTGRFRTPLTDAHSFSFVAGSCNSEGDHPVWQAMTAQDPLFFLCTGDLHYLDPNSEDLEVHRAPYRDAVLNGSAMRAFFQGTPIAYVWDDHDFSGNGSDASSIGRFSAARAYREYTPHYPMNDDVSIHQAFTIGRVHFILSDLRSNKTPYAMMDVGQYTWLLQQFLHARNNGLVACWVSPLTWNSEGWPENWACQPDERRAINDFLYAQQVKDVFIISGDAHMLAIDDGTNADFSTAQNLAYHYPILQAAAISRYGSYKGGNFNQGGVFPNTFPWNGQFGEVKVEDDGEQVCITLNGLRTDSMSTSVQFLNSYTFCRAPSIQDAIPEAATSALEAWYAQGAGLLVRSAPGAPITVRVNDAQGRLLKELRALASPESTLIALNELPPGLYTALLTQGDRRVALRFVRTD